jgi:hypothetical protein
MIYTSSGLRGVIPSRGWCMIVCEYKPCDRCPPLPFIVSRGGAQGAKTKELQCLAAGTSRRTSLSVRAYRRRVAIPCRGSRRVAGVM